jgi:hypothetical protein
MTPAAARERRFGAALRAGALRAGLRAGAAVAARAVVVF